MAYDVRDTKLLELDLMSVQISDLLDKLWELILLFHFLFWKINKEKHPIRPVMLGLHLKANCSVYFLYLDWVVRSPALCGLECKV